MTLPLNDTTFFQRLFGMIEVKLLVGESLPLWSLCQNFTNLSDGLLHLTIWEISLEKSMRFKKRRRWLVEPSVWHRLSQAELIQPNHQLVNATLAEANQEKSRKSLPSMKVLS